MRQILTQHGFIIYIESKKQHKERRKTMWYVKLNDTVLPTPYQYFKDCLNECIRLSHEMCAVRTEPVWIAN